MFIWEKNLDIIIRSLFGDWHWRGNQHNYSFWDRVYNTPMTSAKVCTGHWNKPLQTWILTTEEANLLSKPTVLRIWSQWLTFSHRYTTHLTDAIIKGLQCIFIIIRLHQQRISHAVTGTCRLFNIQTSCDNAICNQIRTCDLFCNRLIVSWCDSLFENPAITKRQLY